MKFACVKNKFKIKRRPTIKKLKHLRSVKWTSPLETGLFGKYRGSVSKSFSSSIILSNNSISVMVKAPERRTCFGGQSPPFKG